MANVKPEANRYESEAVKHGYLKFHYGSPKENLPWDFGPQDSLNYPQKCADLCVKYCQQLKIGNMNRALDIGCSVGRHSFELARAFTEVIGIDYSQSFVDVCNQLKLDGKMPYSQALEGELCRDMEAVIDPAIDRSRTQFMKGDACDLDLDTLGQFDCVLASLLICRLHTPRKLLTDLSHLVAPGGVLVITSPYVFSQDYTPRENWIGAFKKEDGEVVTGFDGLRSILCGDFELVDEENMPLLYQKNTYEYLWFVAHATVWQRK